MIHIVIALLQQYQKIISLRVKISNSDYTVFGHLRHLTGLKRHVWQFECFIHKDRESTYTSLPCYLDPKALPLQPPAKSISCSQPWRRPLYSHCEPLTNWI